MTFVDGVPLVVGPVEDATRRCGLSRESKIGGRVDPPVKSGDGTWVVTGCFYVQGGELWQPEIILTFPEAGSERQVVVIRPVDSVARDHREVPFATSIRRSSVDGMHAFISSYVR